MADVKFYTSMDQAKKLLSLGFDPHTADMCYVYDQNNWDSYTEHLGRPVFDRSFACWSLGALIELLPSAVHVNGKYFVLHMGKLGNEVDWYVSYEYAGYTVNMFKGHSVDAVVDALTWLRNNNLIELKKS